MISCEEVSMTRWIAPVFGFCLALAPAQTGEPKGKPVLEHWDAVYLEGGRAGHVNTRVEELERNGQRILRTTVDLRLNVKRNTVPVQLQAQTGTDETPDGNVVGTFMRQVVGTNKELIIVGLVKGKQLELLLDGKPNVMKPAPWDDRVIGLFRQDSLLADKKVQPGDTFSFFSFEPQVNLVVRMDVAVKSKEEVELLDKKKATLLRVEMTPQKLESVQLPKLVSWLNEERKTVRQDTEIPSLGRITLYRTNREVALAPGPKETLTDIGINQFVPLNKRFLNPYEITSAVYRITVKGDEDAASAFSQDSRQKVLKAKGSTIELQVKASKGLKTGGDSTAKPGDEFTQSSYFITSSDPKVRELAHTAVKTEKDPWKKALLIEKWVNANMRGTNAEALAPADHVARTLEGDCTEYAMLMAAMCRAEGIPSKTAIGLIYADSKKGPALGFHMWTEVWVGGQWIPLDATLGRGFVGATHLKVTDHSWHETRALTPLLPLIRVLGKMQVEVLSP
jgi:transglutaminase-like putative cysteine protease